MMRRGALGFAIGFGLGLGIGLVVLAFCFWRWGQVRASAETEARRRVEASRRFATKPLVVREGGGLRTFWRGERTRELVPVGPTFRFLRDDARHSWRATELFYGLGYLGEVEVEGLEGVAAGDLGDAEPIARALKSVMDGLAAQDAGFYDQRVELFGGTGGFGLLCHRAGVVVLVLTEKEPGSARYELRWALHTSSAPLTEEMVARMLRDRRMLRSNELPPDQ
jgi:hypothetical protein